jgi:CheY-like chemotaxis protein/anti-sigma regulatory factor (Ser/Thr protein kinase)
MPTPRLKILVVDDGEENRLLLGKMLSQIGHDTVAAGNGAEAVSLFVSERPDLVLMDVMMPVMDGYEATARIRAIESSRTVPIIFVTGRTQATGLAHGLAMGGDDYLTKPVSVVVLEAKIKAAWRTIQLNRDLRNRNAELSRYREQAEEEKVVAARLMERLIRADKLVDPALRHLVRPAEHLSGDLVACARTPSGDLHVLIADGTGHGLTASLNVMPVTQPFYTMTEKGFGVGAIAREINAKLGEWLGVGRFVAVTLIAVNPQHRTITVWNGGNPPVLVLARGGRTHATFASRQLPLGILADAELDVSVETCEYTDGMQVFACSDGVPEAMSPTGEAFGRERLDAVLAGADCDRIDVLADALDEHFGGGAPNDDVAIVLVDCDAVASREAGPASRTRQNAVTHVGAWNVGVSLGPEELGRLDAVPVLLGLAAQLGDIKEHAGRLFLVLSELFNNALDHGVLGLASSLKDGPDGIERYLGERSARLAALGAGRVDIRIETIEPGPALRIRVSDSGSGFDAAGVVPAGRSGMEPPHSRGLSLVRSICRSVEFNADGNEVVAIYDLMPDLSAEPDVRRAA